MEYLQKFSFFLLIVFIISDLKIVKSGNNDISQNNLNRIDGDYTNTNNKISNNIGQVVRNPACQQEITRICDQKADTLSDLEALECILNRKRNEADELSDQCNHVLWLYRNNITQNSGFLGLAELTEPLCIELFKESDCWKEQSDSSNLVNCLIDHKESLQKESCKNFLGRLESVIFSDYKLIGRFAQKCMSDIDKLKCGRNEVDGKESQKLPITQGRTLECLSDKISVLGNDCAVEILRIAELQVDDYHLDRALYFACRDDREKFCPHVAAGEGKVYKCLNRNRMEAEMSSNCREQIFRRQKMGWRDYKTTGIVFTCKVEIKRFRCRREANSNDKQVRLSQILLCLENAAHTGKDINGDCVEDLRQHRKALMDDFRINPEIIEACEKEKTEFCNVGLFNGLTLHCLMGHAQSLIPSERISAKCRIAIEDLMKIVDVSTDWDIDSVLKENCQSTVDRSHCSKLSQNKILDCLMNLLLSDSSTETDASLITEDCEKNLLQIQYFLQRDFKTDSMLFSSCQQEASRICKVNIDQWENTIEPNRGPLVLSCLYRNINSDKSVMSPKCAERVKETMRQRALSVHLMPEMEEVCLNDLADICTEHNKPGEEVKCLQENTEELTPECLAAVRNFTQIEINDPTIDPMLWKYCKEHIKKKCSSDDKSENVDIVDCLVDLKADIKSKKCRINIEHMQLLRLRSIHFSPKFKSQCQESVTRYCKIDHKYNKPLTASRLVACLSEIIRNDTLSENTPTINKGCRKQVKYLTLSKIQLENDKADIEKVTIYSRCKNAIHDLCPGVEPGQGRLYECLRKNKAKIEEKQCLTTLFKLEEDTNNDPGLDVQLERECENEIKLYCQKSPNMFYCLVNFMNKKGVFNFEEKCHNLLMSRLIEQNSDLRLNPGLRKDCKMDINKFCGQVRAGEGRILACLKRVFITPKNRMSPNCYAHIESLIENAAKQDIRLDNNLNFKCIEEINVCKLTTQESSQKGNEANELMECLKNRYNDKKIKSADCRNEVQIVIQSTLIDIHVDPILNQACANDLLKRCDGIPPGEGRLMSCLLNELDIEKGGQKGRRLSPLCSEILGKRAEMFKMAGKEPLETFPQLLGQIGASPHKNYFLTVAMSCTGIIFIIGLFCGRVTKRKTESKNK